MIKKKVEKIKAIELRKQGLSYSEILARIPVAKSSLSLWLQSVGLSKKSTQRLTEKKLAAGRRGGLARRNQRLALTNKIFKESESEIGKISERELWLIGTALYWAEGSKEKEGRPGSSAQFMNHDPKMIKLHLRWLLEICKIDRSRIGFDLYIHEYKRREINNVIKYWAEHTGFPENKFDKIYYKHNNFQTKRKNVGDKYFGGLKVRVAASSILNRKIQGWVNAICKYCRVV